MNKDKLLQFLLKARIKTYAGDRGKVKPAIPSTRAGMSVFPITEVEMMAILERKLRTFTAN